MPQQCLLRGQLKEILGVQIFLLVKESHIYQYNFQNYSKNLNDFENYQEKFLIISSVFVLKKLTAYTESER
ncbi:hypothetical protein NPIL_153321 [Nephila pilipes]|uniref:Uncharacterized protein n=1 Tax=Nephila pilipes TaxID=299642 RepID=A0A8X6TIP0_NEPPI|nr:hypothetical protein NPIL_153321 [Nephila pilipes]